MHLFLEQQLQYVSHATALMQTYFAKGKAQNNQCAEFMLNTIKKVSFTHMINQWKIWGRELFDSLADAGFALSLHQALQKYNKIVFFGGNNHAIALQDFTKKLGFTPFVPPQGACTINTGTTKGPAIFTEFSAEQLKGIFATVEKSLQLTALETLDKACAMCGKKGNDLKHCTACKITYYCNQQCQRLHWSQHKKNCIKKS